MNNTEQQLRSLAALKNDPRFAARSVSFRAAQETELLRAIGGKISKVPYTWRDYAAFVRHETLPAATRSFGVATAAIVLMLGSWITTASAASNSLPGDALYGLKLVGEQMQLRLATLDERAVLHTEFAERRLGEAVALQQSGATDQDDNVQGAVNAFKKQIAFASQDLQELLASGDAEALKTATVVESKLSSFGKTLDETVSSTSSTAVSTEVQDAKDATRETYSTAVSVIVDTHAIQQTEYSTRELQDMFQRELGDLRGRQSFDAHRVTVLQTTLATYADRLKDTVVPTNDDLENIAFAIATADEGVADAMTSFALGGYRAAFDTLRAIDDDLLAIEAQLAQSEIAIINAMSAPAPTPEVPTTPEPITP